MPGTVWAAAKFRLTKIFTFSYKLSKTKVWRCNSTVTAQTQMARMIYHRHSCSIRAYQHSYSIQTNMWWLKPVWSNCSGSWSDSPLLSVPVTSLLLSPARNIQNVTAAMCSCFFNKRAKLNLQLTCLYLYDHWMLYLPNQVSHSWVCVSLCWGGKGSLLWCSCKCCMHSKCTESKKQPTKRYEWT